MIADLLIMPDMPRIVSGGRIIRGEGSSLEATIYIMLGLTARHYFPFRDESW
jgi:hypothetical protein